ncbi:MAG: chaperone modulator CbpM [Burkholderiales bacterium]|nr:chaperone modulator CbpM [Burkholderiales bacterium]
MEAKQVEAVWLTEEREFSLAELAELSGLSEPDLHELVDYGAITPLNPDSPQWAFKGECVVTVRAACRLRVNFDLEPHAVALVVSLLDRIHDLEAQLGRLSAQMPHSTQ